MAYKIRIDHLYRCNTKEKPSLYDQTIKEFQDMDKLKDFLKETYYNIKLKPTIRNTLYISDKKGNNHKIGLTYSYWSYPYNENYKVLNTDIITVTKIEYSHITDNEYKEIFKGD